MKNRAVEKTVFSTGVCKSIDSQYVVKLSEGVSAKTPADYLSLESMAIPELPYTLPRLVKGKRIISVPKGSTYAKEEARQNWYIEFFFHNAETGQMERFRPTKNLNRIKSPREKLKHFSNLCQAYKVALEGGWNLLTTRLEIPINLPPLPDKISCPNLYNIISSLALLLLCE